MAVDPASAAYWDANFSGEEFLYGTEPNGFFKEQLDRLRPGRLLLPSEGEGRNAVYAAAQGWEVEAFDLSAVAREKALALAQRAGVHLEYRLVEFGDPAVGSERFDAVALLHAHVSPAQRASGLRAVREALVPGGVLILEGFSPSNVALKNGFGPSVDMCYRLDELREVFVDFEVDVLAEQQVDLDAGRHQGSGIVLRMLARKPTSIG